MGVTKAAEDAVALTDCISRHGANASGLQAYEQERLQAGQMAVARARKLGAYMQATAQASGNLGQIQRDSHTVMMETAIDLSITHSDFLTHP
jgi:2-polyprenyl-6-methoxyphenol hydroxylase-like FAD-dependent oxidoreductase